MLQLCLCPSLCKENGFASALSSVSDIALQRSSDILRPNLHSTISVMVSDRLHKLVAEAHKLAKTAASTFIGGMDTETRMLHVSLTRPMTIRAYERDEFVREAIDVAHHAEFHRTSLALAFSRFAHLQNDQETRDFLVLEIGTGREIVSLQTSTTYLICTKLSSAVRDTATCSVLCLRQ